MKKLIKYSIILLVLFSVSFCYAQADKVDLEGLKGGFKNTVVTVTTSATALPATALSGRRVIYVENLDSTTTVYIGDVNVTADETATGGKPLRTQGANLSQDYTDDIIVYGIVAAGTAKVIVLEAR